jgi:ABC-2 type transport system ATP-binding protein
MTSGRATSALAVEAEGLVKQFGKTRALDGLDLKIAQGGVYGVLGPNGAGKTTAIRILATLAKPDAGHARVLGFDVVREPEAVRSRMSLIGQFSSVDDDLTGIENLVFLGRLFGYSASAAKVRAHELLEAFGLSDAGAKLARHYSGGMKRRLDIASSIVVTPELIFLDEPTTGLDPRSRNQVWDVVRALVAEGTTVLLTTQYLEEADQLTNRIAVIDRGIVIAEGTPGELKASVGAGAFNLRLDDPGRRAEAQAILVEAFGVPVALTPDPAALSVRLTDTTAVPAALTALAAAGITVANLSVGQPSLDEVFLALTGHVAEEPATEEKAS